MGEPIREFVESRLVNHEDTAVPAIAAGPPKCRINDRQRRHQPGDIPPIAESLQIVSEDQAAAILLLHVQTLRKWRRNRQGPPHIAIGAKRIGYRVGDLRDWQDERRAG